MMMPIVSMNKMAMNESIAVTCCFREVATPTAVYWEVLNGGWIGSGFVNIVGWYDDLESAVKDKVWTKLDNDISVDDGSSLRSALTNSAQFPVYSAYLDAAGNTQTGWHVPLTTNGTANVALGDLNYTNNYWKKGPACDHTSGTCKYRYDINEHLSNQHFESKTKHSDLGANFAAPHDAEQYNS